LLRDDPSSESLALSDLLIHYLLNAAPGSETAARSHDDLDLSTLASNA
jgi:hypothetical protein